eukprot:186149-Pyramimonas_sp.AAC.1
MSGWNTTRYLSPSRSLPAILSASLRAPFAAKKMPWHRAMSHAWWCDTNGTLQSEARLVV